MNGVRRLIVNADDYGLCDGVDRGIREAAQAGIVTSVSVLVGRASADAVRRLRDAAPHAGIGLHVDLTSDLRHRLAGDEAARIREQFERFADLHGAPPDHVDTHKHLHRGCPEALDAMASLGVPVRADRARVRRALRRRGVPCTDRFLGDVGPAPWWTVARLRGSLLALGPGTTELMCHPGYEDGIPSSLTYRAQRVAELHALTAPAVRRLVEARGIRLVSFAALARAGMARCG